MLINLQAEPLVLVRIQNCFQEKIIDHACAQFTSTDILLAQQGARFFGRYDLVVRPRLWESLVAALGVEAKIDRDSILSTWVTEIRLVPYESLNVSKLNRDPASSSTNFRPCHPIDACECRQITFQCTVKLEDLCR